ncbi:MAG: ATP-binding protein [Thermoanaerobaculia bacterium]|nr:ATP-binding protein [Thermoanaerobaculia bacterium]
MRTPLQVFGCAAILAVLLTCPAQGQEYSRLAGFNPRFETFTLPGEDGSNNVQCIVQDSTGFVWFASMKGLHRFDGQHVVTYRHDPKDPFSIATDYIEWVCPGRNGILWLGHGEGVSAFDPRTEKCVHYSREAPDPQKRLIDNRVSVIVEDTAGMIWIGTSGGLDRLDPRDGTVRHFTRKDGLSHDLVRSLYVDRRGTLWAGCGTPFDLSDAAGKMGGLNRYNPDGTFTSFLHDPSDPKSLANNQVRAIFEDSRGQFWVGTSGVGLHRMDRNTGAFTRLPFDPAHPSRLGSPVLQRNTPRFPPFYHVGFISEDQDGRLWIGAIEGGLNVYDPRDNAMKHFEMAEGMVDSLQTNYPWHFCQTRDGAVWLASAGLGGKVFRVRNCNVLFPYYGPRQLGASPATIPGILKDAGGNIWLQLRDKFNGIGLFDRKGNPLKRFRYDPPLDTMTFLDFEDLGADPWGNIWASTPKGLYRLDQNRINDKNAAFVRDTTLRGNDPFSLLWLPYFDTLGNTWIPTFGKGLYLLDRQKRRYLFRHDPANDRTIGGDLAVSVFQDSRGRIWVQGGGTYIDRPSPMFFDLFEPGPQGGGVFKHFLPPGEMGNPGCPIEDDSGNFWFVAFPNGIRKLNPNNTREYKAFTVANSTLSSDHVTAMIKARDGRIWMTANNFIMVLDPLTESIYTYSTHHGVQNLAWTWMTGFARGADGEILFSGDGGFHAFYPEQVSRFTQSNIPQIRLTRLSVLGTPVTPERSPLLSLPVWETREIRLPFEQNQFSFHVSLFDFYGDELTRLEYQLENYDRGWRNDLRQGEATYINVPPGHYVFRVRGMNNIGVRARELQISVTVLPPWWRSWWAYTCWTLLIAGALYGFYRFQLDKKLEHAEAVRLRELDAVKTKLYTNITHEFRTPLTLLIGPAERLLEKKELGEEVHNILQIIRRNGLRLLALVNQMLDLSKLESGKITLHLVRGDVVGYLRYIMESFDSLAKDKNIHLHFQSDPESLQMDFDEERLQQIISNLLSNALKFTPEGGHVYIRLEQSAAWSRKSPALARDAGVSAYLLISVRDTGIGIPEDKLPFIFDRFYQVDDSYSRAGESTGIGLTLTKELVKLMQGDIEVQSRPGWGTEFTVALPIRRESPDVLSIPHAGEGKTGSLHEVTMPAGKNEPLSGHGDSEAPLVLLVEDNADVITYLGSCLDDYRLVAAQDGREGLDMAIDTVPDIIVSDVMMPRMDGFELCRMLKKDLRTSHIPIILLTAKTDMEAKLEGLEHGADVYLTKPFHKEELQIRVRKLLESRRRLQQYYQMTAGLGGSVTPASELPPGSEQENAFVKKARETVEAHLDDPHFDVVKLCRELAMSHSQAHRKLSALTGYSATYFIRYVRLTRAKELLQHPHLSITAIAFDCGFNDPAYFSRVFKQTFGMTPNEWRERNLTA